MEPIEFELRCVQMVSDLAHRDGDGAQLQQKLRFAAVPSLLPG
jgi:hypothetical protein